MDSHSRSASPRDPSRPQHRPPSPPAPPSPTSAFDNKAYQHDESDPNHNDSFASNGPQQNGHNKEPNGDTKTLEAVNLELINLTPKNGNAKHKKDVEVDMNSTNPYDEYFVPVNEHRKYMRGEKLYVTADKRGEKGGCKRPLCWTLLGLVVAAIVALIVLAATGVLFTNSPTPVDQYNGTISSARALGGIGHVHGHDDEHDHDHSYGHDHSMEPPHTHQHGPDIQNDEGHDHSIISEELADSSMYVPKTLEGELKIDNEEFENGLKDPDSDQYREFVTSFSNALKQALFDRNTLERGDNEITVEVVQLRQGSVIVTYRIHWKPKFSAESAQDLLTANTLKMKLNDYLANNNRMISIYHIADDKIATRPVLDLCQINKNDCEHECEFDETTLDFTCICPQGQILDMRNPKKCMVLLDNSPQSEPRNYDDLKQKEFRVLTIDSNTNTMKPTSEEERHNSVNIHVNENNNVFDWKETHLMTPETTTAFDADLNFSHVFGHPNSEPEMITSKSQSSTEYDRNNRKEPNLEPTSEPEPASEPNTGLKPEPSAETEAVSNSKNTAKSILTAEPGPPSELEIAAKPEPTPEPEPTSEPEHTIAPEPSTNPEAASEPESASEPELASEPKPASESIPASEPERTSEPTAKTESAIVHELYTETKTTLRPEPAAEPKPIIDPVLEWERALQSEPVFEPQPTEKSAIEISKEQNAPVGTELSSESATETISELRPPRLDTNPTDEFIEHYATTLPDTEMPAKSQPFDDSESEIRRMQHNTDFALLSEQQGPTTQTTTLDVKPVVHIFENQYDYKLNNKMDDNVETTTRISISEHDIITENSLEPNPEIISILSKNTHQINISNSRMSINDNSQEPPEKQVLENINYKTKEDTYSSMNHNINTDHRHETEQRSYKILDDDFLVETTPNLITTLDEDISFDLIRKNEKSSVTEATVKEHNETTETSLLSVINEITLEKKLTNNTITSYTKTAMNVQNQSMSINPENIAPNNAENNTIANMNNGHEEQKDEEVMKKELDENKPLNSTETEAIPTTTPESEQITEYSINKLNDNSDDLLTVLGKKTPIINETSTEKDISEEGNDITFDNINMLYNRSSKSFENSNNTQDIITTESYGLVKDITATETTDSDWLSETVTEVNYNDAMNKMRIHITTESNENRIEEILNRGTTKDDFEPDYLNNMNTNNNMKESDVPVYGMIHDYDSEDSRVKRVNIETKQSTTEINTKNVVVDTNSTLNPSAETTTVSDYIYQTAEKSMNESTMTLHNHTETKNISSIFIKTEPAPVWEDSYLEKTSIEDFSMNRTITKDNADNSTNTTTLSRAMLSESFNTTETPDIQNATQGSNLNVTIYEISKHNHVNHSYASSKGTNTHSVEYDDHETEMNPFLPETENNKSLVKKLQEGHDLEPTNLNETQNENVEEHTHNNSEEHIIMSSHNETSNVKEITTTEQDTLFNELLMNVNPKSNNEKSINAVNNTVETSNEDSGKTEKSENKEVLPISTFLLDTDDLDTSKEETTSSLENNVPGKINDDIEYLSVVPIEEERSEEKEVLKKNFRSENIKELNDISDFSKKSDKRTLDAIKLESVTNNEA